MSGWHCKQITTSSPSPIVVCEREDLMAEIERLRAVIADARDELDAGHRRIEDVNGCTMCWPHDGSWPCTSKTIADDLRNALKETP